MPCIPKKSDVSGKTDWLCVGGSTYIFEGYRFEIHSYHGPVRLNKNNSMHYHQPVKFFEAVERWQALPVDEREKYRVEN